MATCPAAAISRWRLGSEGMSNAMPIAMGWGWSTDRRKAFATAIRYFCRPGWAPLPIADHSHMFTCYMFGDYRRNVIHEALGSHGWCANPLRRLAEWHMDDPLSHLVKIEWLDIPEEVVAAIYAESLSWIGTRSYAWQQIAYIALSEMVVGRLLRRCLPGIFNRDVSDDAVVCHEGAHRLVGERWPALDLRRPNETWAAGSPQELWIRYNKLKADRKTRPQTGYSPASC